MRRHLTLEEISAWFDGEIELGEPEHKHLRECGECGAVLDGHSRLRRRARQAMPPVPAEALWLAVAARLTPAPAPIVDHGVPASRALVPRRGAAAAADIRRSSSRWLRVLASRATASLLAVAAICAVLLLVPRTPHRAPPAVPAPAPRASPVATPDLADTAAKLRTVQSRLGRITFELGKSTLDGASEPALREVAAILVRAPQARVVVEGHTDDTGGAAWNLSMSRGRADAVVRWLVERGGIAPRRLSAKGWGSARPVADNATEAGQAANRRVEFAVVAAEPAAAPVPTKAHIRKEPAVSTATPPAQPREIYTGTRFVLTADRFTTAGPDLISAAGHVRIEPVTPGEPYFAVVDGFSRTLTGPATGIVGEVINPGEHLILHTGAKGTPVHPVP